MREHIRNNSAVKEKKPTQADVVVVLGAALDRDGRPGPALIRRARHGAALVRQGGASTLLMAGGHGEAEAMRSIALEAGVAEGAIRLETSSRNTFENARETAKIARQHGWRRVMLVTDRWHMPRAVMLFRAAGLSPIAARCDWTGSSGARIMAAIREALAFPRSLVRAIRFLGRK